MLALAIRPPQGILQVLLLLLGLILLLQDNPHCCLHDEIGEGDGDSVLCGHTLLHTSVFPDIYESFLVTRKFLKSSSRIMLKGAF